MHRFLLRKGSALVLALGCAAQLATSLAVAAGPYTPEELFDWAERAYPRLFPGKQTSQNYGSYRYRYYPDTQNYLGVSGQDIALLGPASGGVMLKVGAMGDFECLVVPANCGVPSPSIFELGDRIGAVRDSTGAFTIWGTDEGLRSDEVMVPGTGVRPLSTPAKQVTFGTRIAALVDLDGQAWGWGYSGRAAGQLSDAPIPFSGRARLQFPAAVRQVVVSLSGIGGWRTIGLLEDGTVWVFPGTTTANTPRQLAVPPGVHTLSESSSINFKDSVVHAVAHDGRV